MNCFADAATNTFIMLGFIAGVMYDPSGPTGLNDTFVIFVRIPQGGGFFKIFFQKFSSNSSKDFFSNVPYDSSRSSYKDLRFFSNISAVIPVMVFPLILSIKC